MTSSWRSDSRNKGALLTASLPLGALESPQLASGAAMDAELACAACIGEAAERYSAAWIAPNCIVRARASALPGEVILPTSFALFATRQYFRPRDRFPFRRWRENDKLGWVRCRSIRDDRLAWLPAGFVFQPYCAAPGEPLLTPSLSTGLACSTSLAGAKVSGLCEVVERDAVSLAWLGQVQPRQIMLRSNDSTHMARDV